MKNTRITNTVKIISFLLCAVILFSLISKIFERKTYDGAWNYMAKLNEFYSMEENSLDYIGIGSSHMYCTINPLEVWKKTGIAGFVLATQQQPLVASYHYIKEAFKTQSPKYVILEGIMVTGPETYDSAVLYNAIDPLKFSANKIEMINNLVEPDERPNYYFNILKYHTRWNSLSVNEFKAAFNPPVDMFKGFVALEGSYSGKNYIPDYADTKDIELSEFNINIMNDIYELVSENGAELILMVAPYEANSRELCEKMKAWIKWAEQKNITVLDYSSMLDEIKIDPQKDYYDSGHLDISGSRKISHHFALHLQAQGIGENNLINKRKWQNDYDTYKELFPNEFN
ncbi:MAG: hypothetical protein J6A69_11905 [Clostridia bacterium]|nr:hypothetical protein [Clostridia bacterium]